MNKLLYGLIRHAYLHSFIYPLKKEPKQCLCTPFQKCTWTAFMLCTAYDGGPPPLFRSASFVWKSSLFLMGGHTSKTFEVTGRIWRADIPGFQTAPEGLWRPVNATTNDSLGGEVLDIPRYGHTATMLETGESDPSEVRHKQHLRSSPPCCSTGNFR